MREGLQIQTSKPGDPSHYSGPLDVIKKIYRTDGIRGIYQGQAATVLREFHGYGMYFLTYEWCAHPLVSARTFCLRSVERRLVQRKMDEQRIQRKDIPMSSAALYGALAGWAMWLTNYPLDVLKSNFQTDALPSSGRQKYKSVVDCARQLVAKQGMSAFANGLTPTLIRSPFVNASTFVVFEMVMRAIQ